MLWLCLHLPDLALEAFGPPPETPLAIFERQGSRRLIVAVNAAARREGVQPGHTVAAAQAMSPALQLAERNPRQEQQALHSLAAWAEQFGSELFFDAARQSLWLEIGESLRYFGGLESLQGRMRASLEPLGYHGPFGIAPTPEAAHWLAQLREPPVAERPALLARLARLPLTPLPFPEVRAALHESGVRTLGDLRRLPPDSLARRFGPPLVDYLQRLVGERADARPRYRAPRTYRRRMEFLGSIGATEGLLFPIRRALIEFQGYLRARDSGVQQFVFEFEHEDAPPTRMAVGLTAASRDAGHFLIIVRERLERLALPEAATGLVLRADRFLKPEVHQGDLFDQRLQQDGEWLALLEKLQARLGPEALQFLGLRAEHLPERAWHAGQRAAPEAKGLQFPERPFWLLTRPQPLRQPPRLRSRPERIEGGWWDGADAQRDYFVAEAENGSRLWVYRDAAGGWYMHGLWA